MGQHGGKREGAGRKTKANEANTTMLSCGAIINKFGSLEAGLEWLIESREPSLIKFVFEHALGKPAEKIQHSGEITQRVITGMEIK